VKRSEVIESLRDYFDSIDMDGSGEIDAVELSRAMRNIGMVEKFVHE
jgi:Ca2+-binding EF-hand superfamily protein